jgi:hypothetical protein
MKTELTAQEQFEIEQIARFTKNAECRIECRRKGCLTEIVAKTKRDAAIIAQKRKWIFVESGSGELVPFCYDCAKELVLGKNRKRAV